MGTLGEYLGAGSATTKALFHLNGSSTDSSGNGNNGTDTAITYSLANGKLGQGAGFNGTSSKIICGSYGFTTNFTIIAWINPTGNTNRTITGGTFIAGNGQIQFRLETDNNLGLIKQGVAAVSQTGGVTTNGVYQQVAVTYDSSGNFKFYINGKNTASGTNLVTFNSSSMIIGSQESSSGVYAEWMNGAMDEVITENRVWTATEIQKLYTYQKGRFGII